jgi:hypothetical protein
MLDVLGLSNQIKDKDELLSVMETYKKLISEARKAVFRNDTMEGSQTPEVINFEVGEFVFDTIVLVSPPITTHSTCSFILSVVRLMELFAKNNMPLRGAIGIGDYCSDEDTQIFLSNIFKRLSSEEQNQQWSGCVLTPEAEQEIISNVMGAIPTSPMQSDILHSLTIPSKSSAETIRWCLNWMYQLEAPDIESLLGYMNGDKSKQTGTRFYVDIIKALPDDAQTLPEEFHPAVKLKTIKTRASMQVRFENENGIAVEPGCKEWSLQVFSPV